MAECVIIVGAGGFGREVALAAESCAMPWQVLGFLDDRAKSPATVEGWPLLGTLSESHSAMRCVVAVGNPRTRRMLCNRLAEFDPLFVTIDCDGNRHHTISVAEGGMLVRGVRTTVATRIGRHFIGNLNCTIGHDVAIGDFVTIAPLVAVSGNVSIGNGVEIGTGACIREGVRIGDGAMIGMGAVVVKDVEPDTVVVGNPAKVIKALPAW